MYERHVEETGLFLGERGWSEHVAAVWTQHVVQLEWTDLE